jgi:hypothetical protein
MSGGQKTPTSTSVTNNAPWSPQLQGQILHAANKANDWANNPANYSVYEGTRVIPFSNQSLSGMNNAQSFAQGAGQNMQNQAGGIINGGGFNQYQQGALGNLTASANNPMMNQMASGQMLGQGNPFLQQALGIANENAMTGVGDAMSAAGRYGSGVHQGTLAKTINDSNTNAMFGQYNTDVNNMMGAANQQVNSASTLFNAGQAGLGNMQSAYQAGLQPTQTLGQIGGAYEDLAGRYAQEQMDKFNESQQKPLDAIAQSNAILTGAGSLGGTNTQKVYQPTQWGQVGANAAGAALAGK